MRLLFVRIILLANISTAQNLIKNGSFEIMKSGTSSSIPDDPAQFEYVEDWDQDMKAPILRPVKLHSPDYFSETPPLFYCYSNAHSGDKYIGMGRGEMIEQDFEGSDGFVFKVGQPYRVKLWVKMSRGMLHEKDWDNAATLSIMLRKDKLFYTPNANLLSNQCSNAFMDHQSDNSSTTLQIGSVQINDPEYSFDTWKEVSIDFTVPSTNWDWIVFETNDQTSNTCDTYILIDDISLENVCQEVNRFSAYKDGPTYQDFYSNNNFDCESPLFFTGLKGAEKVEIIIFEDDFLGGHNTIYAETFYHPSDRLIWNGKKQDGVTEATDGNYNYHVNVYSICGEPYMHQHNFTKTRNCNFNISVYNDKPSATYGFGNLNHIYYLKCVIKNSADQEVRTIEVYDPKEKVLWDGKNNSGSYVAAGIYKCDCQISNPCGEQNINNVLFDLTNFSAITLNNVQPATLQQFLNLNSQNIPFYDITSDGIFSYNCGDFSYYTPVNYPPLPCCSSEPDINLTTGYILGTESFEAYGNIYIGPGVTVLPASNLEFIANGTITIDPGVSFDGSISPVILEYQNCSPQRIGYWPTSVIENNQAIEESKIVETQQETSNKNLLLFPNPTKLTLTLVFPNSKKLAVVVTDMLGKIMLKNSIYNSNPELDVSSLPNGIYFLEAFTETESFIQKFVKE
jgi:hypothetical protein